MSNVAGKLAIDAVSIGLGAVAGILTGGIASPVVATATRIGLGTSINASFDYFMNGRISAKGIAKDMAFATLSVGVAKVGRNVEENLLRHIGQEGLEQKIGRVSSDLTTVKTAKNRPLSSLMRVMNKVNKIEKENNKILGIGQSQADLEATQLLDLERTSDFQALAEDQREMIRKEIKGDGDKVDASDQSDTNNSEEQQSMKPISVKFLLKPDDKKNEDIVKRFLNRKQGVRDSIKEFNVDDFWKSRKK